MLGFWLLVLGVCQPLRAEPYVPSPDSIVAVWQHNSQKVFVSAAQPDDPQAALLKAQNYLQQAGQPGQARMYGVAEAMLKPFIRDATDDPEIWLVWAQIQQHQHSFDPALSALKKALLRDSRNPNAHLMAARIHLIQNNTAAARSACMQLLGYTDLLTATACALEVASYGEQLPQSYRQLSALVQKQGLPDDERRQWLIQILADMSSRLGDAATAVEWLEQGLDKADVSYLAQWADAQIDNGAPQKAIAYLAPIVENAPAVDDALLLRLAKAEKRLKGQHWQALLAQHVQLRERRHDVQHASELAQYYLDIMPNSEKALYWAELNWQLAREHSDKILLARAKAVQKGEQDRQQLPAATEQEE